MGGNITHLTLVFFMQQTKYLRESVQTVCEYGGRRYSYGSSPTHLLMSV